MTLEVDVLHTRVAGAGIGLEGMEVALRRIVLIGQVDVETASLHTQTILTPPPTMLDTSKISSTSKT